MALTSADTTVDQAGRNREDEPRLGCGRPIDDLWAKLDEPPDAHERDCPDCQAARASLTRLGEAARGLREAEERDPAMQPSERTKSSIMELARAEVRRGQMLPLRRVSLPGTSELSISEQSVATLVRHTADAMPGVMARRCRVRPIEEPVGSEDSSGGEEYGAGERSRVRVELSAALSVHTRLGAVTADLRQRVRTTVREQTGLDVVAVDITVEDLFDV